MNADFWDKRYLEQGFAYGKLPNRFFQEKLKLISPGKILLPAEGEGRNAMEAYHQGWEVMAFDISDAGVQKALIWALDIGAEFHFEMVDAKKFLENDSSLFDAVAFVFSHFSGLDRVQLHADLADRVKSGGYAIMEVFAKGHEYYNALNPEVGGPKNPEMLFSVEEARVIFSDYELLEISVEEVTLDEGKYHLGLGLVLRVFARRR